MNCTKCGTKLEREWAFCGACGQQALRPVSAIAAAAAGGDVPAPGVVAFRSTHSTGEEGAAIARTGANFAAGPTPGSHRSFGAFLRRQWIAIAVGVVVVAILALAAVSDLGVRRQLRATKSELSSTQSQLATTTQDLASTRDQLSTTKEELATAQDDLSSAQGQLTFAKSGIATCNSALSESNQVIQITFNLAQMLPSALAGDYAASVQVNNDISQLKSITPSLRADSASCRAALG